MDEQTTPDRTRRPGIPSHPILLADGLAWGFARPTLRLMPIVVAGEDELTVKRTYGYPLEIERHLDALRSALDGGSAESQYESFFTLAAALLRRTHDIDLSTAATLLAVDLDDLSQLADQVLVVALGGLPATSTSSSSEAEHESEKTSG